MYEVKLLVGNFETYEKAIIKKIALTWQEVNEIILTLKYPIFSYTIKLMFN